MNTIESIIHDLTNARSSYQHDLVLCEREHALITTACLIIGDGLSAADHKTAVLDYLTRTIDALSDL